MATGGAGGTGGTPDGTNGAAGSITSSGGGAGGGGGFNGNGSGAASLANIGTLAGGRGGDGGHGGQSTVNASFAGGGGGGAGGYGAVVTGVAASSNAGDVRGGAGGVGGSTFQTFIAAGHGGDGGVGLQFTTSGASVTNTGTIAGGAGGAAGTSLGAATASAGAGGSGIVGSGLAIINSGTISGGLSGNGATRANAITFTGGANTLTLQAGSSLVGNIGVTGSLTLDQATAATLSNAITGAGSVTKSGSGTMTLTGANIYSGGTTIDGGTLRLGVSNTLSTTGAVAVNGGTFDLDGNSQTVGALSGAGGTVALGSGTLTAGDATSTTLAASIAGAGGLDKQGTGTLTLTGTNTHTGGTTISSGTLAVSSNDNLGATSGGVTVDGGTLKYLSGAFLNRSFTLGASGGTFDTSGFTTNIGSITGSGGLTKTGAGSLGLNAATDYSGATRVAQGLLGGGQNSFSSTSAFTVDAGATLSVNIAQTIGSLAGGGIVTGAPPMMGPTLSTLTTGGDNSSTTFSGTMQDRGSDRFALVKTGTGTMTLTGASTHTGGTTINAGSLKLGVSNALAATRAVAVNGGTFDLNGNSQTVGALSGTGGTVALGGGTLTAGDATNTTLAAAVTGAGSFTKQGAGTMILTGGNSYGGGTTVSAGTLQGNSSSLQGAIVNNAAVVFDQATSGTYAGNMSGTGSLTKSGAGLLSLTGTSSAAGGTSITAGTLAVNGGLTSAVTVGSGGTLGGSGTITGLVTNNGTLAPGNSIGTLTITGNYIQNGGIYQVEVNGAGQSDKIAATGTATINGGTVQVIAQQGSYARNTTYTILTATGGVSGVYSNVTSNFAFLTPTLSYSANDVLLTLLQSSSAFASGAQTPSQRAVGAALDIASPSATGDFVTVLNALSVLNTQQGPAALTAISGQNYSGFSSGLVQTGQMFMSNFSAQAGGANRVGSASAASRSGRVERTEACDVACEPAAAGTWGVWGGAIGAAGNIAGNSNAGTMTYNAGGFAAGIDRKITEEVLLGFTLGYASGNQWTQGFSGRGTADTVQAGLYASFLKGPVYVDGLLGYAYSNNQMTRQIVIPGLAQRVATGSTGANQFFGQVETGYRIDIGGLADAYVTPFVRLQGSTATQNGFTESGAGSLNLSVASQTTNSLRSVIGAQIGGAMDMGWREKLAAQFKLGWSHEFASTDRPVTAAFAGAPAVPFTTFGAAPNRDGVVLGFNATTGVAERTSVYFRYEGQVSGADNMHAGTVGLRFAW